MRKIKTTKLFTLFSYLLLPLIFCNINACDVTPVANTLAQKAITSFWQDPETEIELQNTLQEKFDTDKEVYIKTIKSHNCIQTWFGKHCYTFGLVDLYLVNAQIQHLELNGTPYVSIKKVTLNPQFPAKIKLNIKDANFSRTRIELALKGKVKAVVRGTDKRLITYFNVDFKTYLKEIDYNFSAEIDYKSRVGEILSFENKLRYSLLATAKVCKSFFGKKQCFILDVSKNLKKSIKAPMELNLENNIKSIMIGIIEDYEPEDETWTDI